MASRILTFGLGTAVGVKFATEITQAFSFMKKTASVNESKEMGAEDLLKFAVDTMDRAHFAVLGTTTDISDSQHQRPRLRPVEPRKLKPDLPYIRFETSKLSRKFQELHANPNVCLNYFEPDTLSYVSVYGKARQLSHEETKAEWDKKLYLYYPEGPDGGRFVGFKVDPERLEMISLSEGLKEIDSQSWHPIVLLHRNGKWILPPEQPPVFKMSVTAPPKID